YGLRDLYYSPERVPDDFRQPHAHRGMRRGRSELLATGGVNPTLANATHEGGPRNGVMRALDDLLPAPDRPYRLAVLPIYFGLAIVVDDDMAAARPLLVEVLDRLESADGRHDLLELAEALRLESVEAQHNIFFRAQTRVDRVAQRY